MTMMPRKRPNTGRGRLRLADVDWSKVEELASLGLNSEQIARCLGICVASLNSYKNKHAEVQEAIVRGRAKGIQIVTNELRKQILSGNTAATLFYLKCQAHWRETEHQGSLEIVVRDESD